MSQTPIGTLWWRRLQGAIYKTSDRDKSIGLAVVVFLLLVTPLRLVLPGSMESKSNGGSRPFSLLVSLTFTAAEHKEQMLKDIAPLATYVKLHEPETIAYEVLLSDKNPLQVLILERYRDKERSFVQIHRTSQPFVDFRPKLQALQDAGHVTIDGESYMDSGVGFGDRAGA